MESKPNTNKRIDWVGQTHHPQPQDPVDGIRSHISRRSKSNLDNDVQVQQRQEPIEIKGTLDEFLKNLETAKNIHSSELILVTSNHNLL